MKINYTFANGETSDVEVSEEIGTVILDSRREESNLDRKERYHCYSLDATDFEGEDYADDSTPESELFLQLENQHIAETFNKLSEVQKRRLLMLAQGLSLREIARREGKDIKTIRKSIEGARKKFLKFF
jgi:DNA-directed RNA polymerase specialized sigma24 family protein|nr:MAG TPA: RNA polymerase sigma factor [Caudoviricetes sp.]